mgnify:CR=1 FL=1
MDYKTIIGLVAAFLTTAAALPQAIKTIKSRSTKDLSLGMYVMLDSGVVMWLIYGLLVNDVPLIIANVATFVLVTIVLIMKLKYK